LVRTTEQTVTILAKGGGQVHAMLWRLPVGASRVHAFAASQNPSNHINIYTNLSPTWTGQSWDPDPAIGVIHTNWTPPKSVLWLLSGKQFLFDGPILTKNQLYEFDFLISSSLLRTWSDSDRLWNERPGTYQVSNNGIVALGAFGGQSAWSTVVIEGEVAK
jgi:hypothetical protein